MKSVRWMSRNHVAANLLMLVLLVGGAIASSKLKVEVFPEVELDYVSVTVVYPGAGPEEVEDGIIRPIEEAINSVDGVKRVQANGAEGGATVLAELIEGTDIDNALQDIKAAVDRIVTFPQEAERPIVKKVLNRRSVLSVAVYGDLDRHALRQYAERIRDDLLALPNITQAEVSGVPPYEISIEVPEENLRRYGLTLDSVAAAVRAASIDLPAGTVKAKGGEILLRTKERRYTGREYEDVVVLSRPDGTLVRLRDIAEVRDTFAETDEAGFFDGKPAAMVNVERVGEQSPTEISAAVHDYIEKQQAGLPATVKLAVWGDRSEILEQRIDLLLRNAALGLVLVIISLSLFMRPSLAFWVMLGIPISMLGAMIVMPGLDVSINMLTLFAFILVLGIVVDDAIVVGENIYAHQQMGSPWSKAAYEGAVEVGRPVIFSVLTTVAAFAPLLFVGGMMGKFMWPLPVIVMAVLIASLVESLYILPAHLNRKRREKNSRGLHRFFGRLLDWLIHRPYQKTLDWALRNRYTALTIALVSLVLTIGLFAGRHLKMIFMPELEGDVVTAQLRMPFGTPAEVTARQMERMVRAAQQTVAAFDAELPPGTNPDNTILRDIYAQQGSAFGGFGPRRSGISGGGGGHIADIAVFLKEEGSRNVSSTGFANAWRERIGEIPGAESLEFRSTIVHMGSPVDIQLAHDDFAVLQAAADRIKAALANYSGLFDIADSYEEGKRELKLRLRPEARALGIQQQDLARQVRGAFYGAEALRLQRERNELKVMVRYPLEERRSLADVDSMRIRTPAGGEIPFGQAAFIDEGRGYSEIKRVDRRRVINVTARANLKVANPQEIVDELGHTLLPQLMADYPGLSYDLEGEQRERRETMRGLMFGLLAALLLIYALLAVPSKSYAQPLIIMSAIPFGLIGAVIGHLLLGYDMSMMSFFGVVALAGVVVNDSLVMVDFINRIRDKTPSLKEAVIAAGKRRFRPIVLTTLTTFFALMPMLAETSVQARFLVPMAISLAFGVVGATLITLVLVPTLYMILEDAKRGLGRAWAWVMGRPAPRPGEQPGAARQVEG